MPEPLKGFWLQSLFPLTRDVLLDWAKDLYHLYPNPTACPVSNDILWFYSFFQYVLAMTHAVIFNRIIVSLQTLGLV